MFSLFLTGSSSSSFSISSSSLILFKSSEKKIEITTNYIAVESEKIDMTKKNQISLHLVYVIRPHNPEIAISGLYFFVLR